MATPPTLPALATQVATLQTKVDALQAWADQIVALAASREKRIADLEAFAANNATLIAGLSESDEASGWKKWRENQKKTPDG